MRPSSATLAVRRLPVLAALGRREVYRSGDEAFLRHTRSMRLPVLAALGRMEFYRSGDEAFLRPCGTFCRLRPRGTFFVLGVQRFSKVLPKNIKR